MKTSQKFTIAYTSILLTILLLLLFGNQISEKFFPSSGISTVPSSIITTKTLVVETSAPTETPPITETSFFPKVTITGLKDGQTVPCLNNISGTYSPDLEEEIWVMVYISGRFYPQDSGGKAAQKVGGIWYQTVRFGNCDNPNPADVGKTFRLVILTADESANAVFETYIAHGLETNNWEGMIELPPGVEQQLSISVIRE